MFFSFLSFFLRLCCVFLLSVLKISQRKVWGKIFHSKERNFGGVVMFLWQLNIEEHDSFNL